MLRAVCSCAISWLVAKYLVITCSPLSTGFEALFAEGFGHADVPQCLSRTLLMWSSSFWGCHTEEEKDIEKAVLDFKGDLSLALAGDISKLQDMRCHLRFHPSPLA
eukprot:3145964-Amphidinium_carterae.1